MVTTIKVLEKTKNSLDQYKEHPRESYDNVVRKLIFIAETSKTSPMLSKKTVMEIEKARQRIKEGDYYSENQVKKMLGLE